MRTESGFSSRELPNAGDDGRDGCSSSTPLKGFSVRARVGECGGDPPPTGPTVGLKESRLAAKGDGGGAVTSRARSRSSAELWRVSGWIWNPRDPPPEEDFSGEPGTDAKPRGLGNGTEPPRPPRPPNGTNFPRDISGRFFPLSMAVSSRKPALSMDLRLVESPTWYRCLFPSRSAPLRASTDTSLSSNTSIGVCAFHLGMNAPLAPAPFWYPVEPGYQDPGPSVPSRAAPFAGFEIPESLKPPNGVAARSVLVRSAAADAAAATDALLALLGGRADATQPVSPSPTQPSPPPISTTPASSSYGREGKEIFSEGLGESDDEDASRRRLSTTSPTSSSFRVSSAFWVSAS